MCLKRKTNELEPISDTRRAILTHVPADVRMKIYGSRHNKEMKNTLIWTLTKIYAILVVCTILEYILDNDVFWYGYFLGVGVSVLMMMLALYNKVKHEWRPPSNEEMNELGDELI